MSGSTISTKVTIGITLGNGGYDSPLTVTGAGEVDPATAGTDGVYAAVGIVINQGSITGSQGAALAGPPQYGGIGVALSNATLLNYGTVLGGEGGGGNPGGGKGGGGVDLHGGALSNSGTVIGGTGAIDGGNGGGGGAGLYLYGGTVSNSGSIIGGVGGAAMYGKIGAAGGAGIVQTAGLFTNTGTVIGGVSDTALKPGSAGYGLIMTGGSTENQGLIEGGKVDSSYRGGGTGLYIVQGTLTNDGRIDGAASAYTGGPAAHVIAGRLINEADGSIAGGTGTQGGGGVRLSGAGTVENYGAITGGAASGYGVDLFAGSFMNAGVVTGGLVVGSYLMGPVGGGTATNTGSIAGGAFVRGGVLNNSTSGIISGHIGINVLYGMVNNAGTIAAATAGIGAFLYGGTLVNTGDIAGGAGAGDGVSMGISDLINSGTIIAGASNAGPAPSAPGGIGVDETFAATLSTTGTILGGSGGLFNSGGDGVVLNNSSCFNSGLIEGGFGSIGGRGVYLHDATFTNAGTIEGGQGAVVGDAISLGFGSTLTADPGAVFDGAVVADPGDEFDLGAGTSGTAGTLDMGGSFSGLSSIVFDVGATWNLAGDIGALAQGQKIAGFTGADTILLEGFTATSHTFITGTGLELSNGATTETIDLFGGFSTSSFIVTDQAGGTEIQLCYLRGTNILTPAGEVPIETLNIGDAVITRFNGYRRIKWIGRQSFGRRFIETNRAQLPIRIAAGALGPLLPKRDLYVSPGHSMLIGNVLVLASSLINGVTITQSDCLEEVHYYQVEFDTHDCVQAEGCWSESFCDYADLRNQFHNVADFHGLFPNHVIPTEHLMCAIRPEHGPALEAALRPIAARAAALVPPGPLQGWIDHIHPSGVITGWAQDTAQPELPVLLEILLRGRLLGTILACDHRADLAAAGIGQGPAAFAYKTPTKVPRAALPTLQIRRAENRAVLPMASHCLTNLGVPSRPHRERA